MEEWRGGGGGGGGNTSSTIDIKFNYPQTSANHYFVQQSQLLPFKRFQSIQRRRRGEGGEGGPRISGRFIYTPAHSIHPSIHRSIHQRFRYFSSSSNAESADPSLRAFQEEGFYRSPFLKHQNRARRGGESLGRLFSVPVSNPFPMPVLHRLCHRPISFFFPPLLLLSPPPILSTTNDISHGVEVSTVFFFFSLPTLWKIGGGGGRKNGDRSLCERIFQFTKILLVCFFEMDIKVI